SPRRRRRSSRRGHVRGPGRGRPGDAGGGAHDGRGRAQRRHGPHARADRALPRRRGRALRRLVHPRLRAGPDGRPRRRDRRGGGPDVHADLRTRREHPMIAELSERLRMPAFTMEDMRAHHPAFDLVTYSEAARRACVALRDDDGAVSIVLGDPFDLDTQDWIEERLAAPFRYRLASRADVEAYLAQQEAGFKALDAVSKEFNPAAASANAAQEISFEAAAEG